MKRKLLLTIAILLVNLTLTQNLQAQDTNIKDDTNKSVQATSSPSAPQAITDEINFKNETGNAILTVTDEGNNAGSITLPSVGSVLTGAKLFNNGGNLFWGSNQLNGSSGTTAINDLTDAKYGGFSLFLGLEAGTNDAGNNYNTGLGYRAYTTGGSGVNNTAIAAYALHFNTTGGNNTATGGAALYQNTTGHFNVGIGQSANRNNQAGSNNTIIGFEAGMGSAVHNKSGNIFLGYQAGKDEVTDDKLYIENTSSATPLIYGDFATDQVKINGELEITTKTKTPQLQVTTGATTGHILTSDATGNATWQASSGGGGSGATQIDELTDAKTFENSIYIGQGAGIAFVGDGSGIGPNLGVGVNALASTINGRFNTAIGFEALKMTTYGEYNTATGYKALFSNEGYGNIANGYTALLDNTNGGYNTAVGGNALRHNTIGNYNVGIGYRTNEYNLEGSNNTIVGYRAGGVESSHSKSDNVFLGYNAGYNETSDGKLFVENSSSSSPLIWGDFTNDRLVINGNASSNSNNRTFFSNGEAGGTTAWFNDSDRRLKKNIATITNALEKVKQLRGVNYNWKETEHRGKGLQMGFIAQEANQIIPEVVDNSGDHYSMQYAPITALLVEAIKEQDKRIKKLEDENKKLRMTANQNDKLETEIKIIKATLSKLINQQPKIKVSRK